MSGVFARQYTWMTGIIFLAILIVVISFVTTASSYISDMQQTRLSSNANTVSKLVSASLADTGRLDIPFRITFAAMGEVMTVHMLICDTNGKVIMCSDSPFCAEHAGKTVPEQLTRSVMNSGSHVEQSLLGGIYSANYNLAAHTVTVDGTQIACFVIVASPASENRALVSAFMKILSLISAIVLVVSFVSAYIVTKRMTKPLKAMAVSAQSYARGDFSTRVPVSCDYHDEISILCANFNMMADSLQQLEELRQGFIANVSHELRTPMTVISGYVDGIIDGTIPDESRLEHLKIIRGEVLRLSRLVAKMMDITHMQSGQMTYTPRPVNACELMRQVILGFERRIDSGDIQVECVMPDSDAAVNFDPDALTQVFTNLMDNAVKFTPEGGRLIISFVQKGGKANVSVANSGSGIPAEDLPFVFDRFYKTDKSRSSDRAGLGLGLYIVRSILQSHGENIQVSSDSELTTFTFTLTILK